MPLTIGLVFLVAGRIVAVGPGKASSGGAGELAPTLYWLTRTQLVAAQRDPQAVC